MLLDPLPLLLIVLLYVGGLILLCFIAYLIIKAAVRNGIGEAMVKYGFDPNRRPPAGS